MELKGMTWSHSRGYSSIIAATQRYEELHPGVSITWDKRPLSEFENQPVTELAGCYDMVILDHPWMGFSLENTVFHDLNNVLPASFLADLGKNSAGRSFESYTIDGQQLALPVDGATPIAVYRPEVLGTQEAPLPNNWNDMIGLAKKNQVILAAMPIYTMLDFYMMCSTITDGEESLYGPDEIAPKAVMEEALERQRELLSHCPSMVFDRNPIEIYEILSHGEVPYTYCPFIYGYVNYFRAGYSKYVLKASEVVTYQGKRLKTTLGGTGLAVFRTCKELDLVADFSQYVMSETVQKTIFADAGGQPGHAAAWTDEAVNRMSNNFYRDTLDTMAQASMRPRYNGCMELQDHGGVLIREYLQTGKGLDDSIEKLNALYLKTRGITK